MKKKIGAFPKVSGSNQLYLSTDLNNALTQAENEAVRMKDEFVSVEHIFIGILKKASGSVNELFRSFGITEKNFMEVLKNVRGNVHVTSQNPEGTYDVLKKYGQDLVELARQNKLDPVIGRDSRDQKCNKNSFSKN